MSGIHEFDSTNKEDRLRKNYSEIIKASQCRQLWSISGHYFPDCTDKNKI